MHEDQLLPAEPGVRAIARELYRHAKDLPLISPHGHVDPAAPADPLGRSADAAAGARALLVGLAANESINTGRPVRTAELEAGITHA